MKTQLGKTESTFSSADLAERTVHRRAVEAVVRGMPVVNYDLMYQAMVQVKGALQPDRLLIAPSVVERDKAMFDQLKSIGIEKGKDFKPDAKTQDILNDAAREAQAWLVVRYETSFSLTTKVATKFNRQSRKKNG